MDYQDSRESQARHVIMSSGASSTSRPHLF